MMAATRVAARAMRPVAGMPRRLCSSAAQQEYAGLKSQLEHIKQRMHQLERSHPEVRSPHAAADGFTPPKLHHINLVTREVNELLGFYRDVMRMDELPVEMFARNEATESTGGTDVPIRFTSDGAMQMHLAMQDLSVAFRSNHTINPIERGHIAYRTDDIDAFKAHLDRCGVHYSDYGTVFAKEWHQIFFLDPVGTVVEVHAVVA